MDSEFIKTTQFSGECRSFDDDKLIIGHLRPIVSDTIGLLLAVVVPTANIHDGKGVIDFCY